MSNKQKVCMGVIIAILCSIAFYFLYWTKTPEYSLSLVQEAIKNHNTEKFERHVDLDSLYSRAYDDFISKTITSKDKAGDAGSLVSGFLQMFKPTIVSALKDATLKAVSGTQDLETSAKNEKGDIKRSIDQISNTNKNSQIKKISVISKESEVSIVAITLHDNELNSDFDLKVKMNKLENGEWRIKEITNLIEYIDAVKLATIEKAKLVDKPIKEKIYKNISAYVKGGRRYSSGGWLPTYYFSETLELENLTDQSLKDIKVYAKIFTPEGKFVKTLEFNKIDTIAGKTKHTATANVKLNEFDSNDNKLIKEDLRNYFSLIYVTSIKTADGVIIERPKEVITDELYPEFIQEVKKEREVGRQNVTKEPTTGFINATDVIFRDGPGTEYKSIGIFDKNEPITIQKLSPKWYKVARANGKSGWVSSQYVTLKLE